MEDTRKGEETSVAGDSLEQVRQQLQDWRAGRKLGTPIPAPLWAAAVGAAREHGLHRVAARLNLDYAGLKGRVEGADATTPRAAAAPCFVELFAPAASVTSAAERA